MKGQISVFHEVYKMAQQKVSRSVNKRRKVQTLKVLMQKYVNVDFGKYLVFDPAALPVVSVLILLAELVINVVIIQQVPYTEIDWIAYMQECEGFLNGTTNYALLRGDTGPLVYPAAFVYIYTTLYYVTSQGTNIRRAQFVFAGIYLLQMWLVLRLYTKSRKVQPYVLVLSAFTSYRIHSIYVLRLFNDPLAILFLYAALNLFVDRHWSLGSIAYSVGVGIKMNILLFAPAVLLFYLANLRCVKTILQLIICGLVQLLLGAPFLLTYPLEYLKGSFDVGRVFEHKWTVNYRFMPKTLFKHKYFHLGLLALHLLLLLAIAKPTWTYFKSYVNLRVLQKQLQPQLDRKNRELNSNKPKVKNPNVPTNIDQEALSHEQKLLLKTFERTLKKSASHKAPPSPTTTKSLDKPKATMKNKRIAVHFEQCVQLALLPFFLINLIGVVCARSLHYQFYVWYFHSLPYLVWSTPYSLGVRFLLLGAMEYCWNTYPSTNVSSTLLHMCHFLLLIGVGRQIYQTSTFSDELRKRQMQKAGNEDNQDVRNTIKLN